MTRVYFSLIFCNKYTPNNNLSINDIKYRIFFLREFGNSYSDFNISSLLFRTIRK